MTGVGISTNASGYDGLGDAHSPVELSPLENVGGIETVDTSKEESLIALNDGTRHEERLPSLSSPGSSDLLSTSTLESSLSPDSTATLVRRYYRPRTCCFIRIG